MPEIDIGRQRFEYDKDPDHCPLCHHGISPSKLATNLRVPPQANRGTVLQIVYRCPREECQLAFIATFSQDRSHTMFRPEGCYLLRQTEPWYPQAPGTHDDIKKLSPDYHKIFGQSAAAEAYRLDQIAGVGYRKALEYLIKDYLIHKRPDETDAIKSKLLGRCVSDYVTDINVRKCAERAAWLGNDETHYVRKWGEKDITDLKVLLQLTSAWILNELLTEKYLNDMPSTATERGA